MEGEDREYQEYPVLAPPCAVSERLGAPASQAGSKGEQVRTSQNNRKASESGPTGDLSAFAEFINGLEF